MRANFLVLATALAIAAPAVAQDAQQPPSAVDNKSTRRPFYIQAAFATFSLWANFPGSDAYWHPDVEFGLHFTGRHDGFVLGVRQAFDIGAYPVGATVLRAGWDVALPFRNGRFELTLAPFVTVGVDYLFNNGVTAGIRASGGIEGKIFFYRGLYLLVRPIELGVGDFSTTRFPFPAQNAFFNLNLGAGLGYAF